MRREFTIQSKVDGLVLDGLVVEPEEGVQRTALLQLSHGTVSYTHLDHQCAFVGLKFARHVKAIGFWGSKTIGF